MDPTLLWMASLLSTGVAVAAATAAWQRAARDRAHLQATTDHARSLLDALGHPVLVIDPTGRVREANGMARTWLGPIETLPAWLAGRVALHGTIADLSSLFGRSGTVEGRLDGPDAPRTVQMTLRPGHLLDGERCMVVGITDVTALKRAQESGARAAIAEREANEVKSRFLANMSHELRTPLSTITGYTEMLLEDEPSPEQVRDLEHIRSASDHLLRLIDQVLDLSKLEAGRLSFVAEPVDVDEVIAHAVEAAEVLARRHGNLLVVPTRGLGVATLDGLRLKQVLLNLLSNACKFTQGGRVVVAGRDLGDAFVLTVADTGEGIPPAALAHLFEPFFQVENDRSRTRGGTGLGLAITRHFVERLGGELSVESTVGVGTTFTVMLPREMPSDPPPRLKASDMTTLAPAPSPRVDASR